MIAAYLADLAGDARVLEVGCGTGAIARELVTWPGVGEVLGVDPSPILLDRARKLGAGIDNLSFQEGDGRRLSLPDAAFDAVVLSHVPGPEDVLAEAFRVLRPGGRLAVSTATTRRSRWPPATSTRSTAAWRRTGRPTSPIRGGSGGCPRSCTPPALPTAACAAAASSRSTTPTTR
jgi:ubiquinone/menaquinone biosynthesis C-methylase UbiE